MNASCEEFAKQIEDSNGRQDVSKALLGKPVLW